MRPYTPYSEILKGRGLAGLRIRKICLHGGFTCPNRDGNVAWGGCTYCNNDSFRPDGVDRILPAREQIQNGIAYLVRRYAAERFLVYWQHYTNTYAPVETLRQKFLEVLTCDPRIVGMCIGTRPDCVDNDKLEMIREVSSGRYVCLEYGLESSSDSTLLRLNRGHTVQCWVDAVGRTKGLGLPVCAHVILGFPWETRQQMLDSAGILNQLEVDFVKIHHLHVVKNTRLAQEFEAEPFPTFSLREWVELVCDYLERLDPKIVVQRLFGWAPGAYLIAPRWKATRPEILNRIRAELQQRHSRQGLRFDSGAAVAS